MFKFLKSLNRIITGQLSQKQLSDMTDYQIAQYVNFDNRGGRYETQFSREQARRMSDVDLMEQINYDAEDGRINTVYSAEYQSRKQLFQGATS